MRLNKYLAHSGICSRREADKLIEQGKVVVNGCIPTVGQCVNEEDIITVEGKWIKRQNQKVVIAFYKPVGVTCTEKDVHAEKKVSDMIHYPIRLTYAGRLDKDSEGLLLLTNDGDLIQNMMRGANYHEKEYLVRVNKEVTPDFLSKLNQGVYLKELAVTTRKCRTEIIGKYTFKIILTQGVNRQIRRMCAVFGYEVKALKRIRVMHVTLGNLRPGEYVQLSESDVQRLYRDCGMETKRTGRIQDAE